MPTILITGAASGLGKAFLHAYATQDPTSTIYAIDRSFPPDLNQSAEGEKQHIIPITCDLTDAAAVAEQVGSLRLKLDLVVHSAGVRGLVPAVQLKRYSDVAGAESLESMDAATMMRTFEINTVGTFLLLKALLPSLSRGVEARLPKVVVMGSRMGSVGHNTELGGAYAYRASKAALNAVVKSFSVDVPGVVWTVVHPGRVQTGLVEIREDDAMDVDEVVVRDLVPLIAGLGPVDSGRFVDRFGADIPW